MRNLVLIFSIWISFAACSHADQPKTEFLLVGVLHHISDSLSCNWKMPYQKLVNYHPDQIAVEYVAPEDTANMKFYLGEGYIQTWDSITMAWEGKKINIRDSVARYTSLLSTDTQTHIRSALWKYYYLHTDMANEEYQLYQLHQKWSKQTVATDSSTDTGKLIWPFYKTFLKNRSNSEYFNLVYPLAQHYKINYLYPTDYRLTYPAQGNAYEKFVTDLDGTDTLKKYQDMWSSFVERYEFQKKSCSIFAYNNTRKWLEEADHLQAQVLNYTANPHFAEYAKVWYLRNEMIAKNIVAASKKSNAKRMAVFYGDMHIAPLKKYLEQQGYKVVLLEDLK